MTNHLKFFVGMCPAEACHTNRGRLARHVREYDGCYFSDGALF